MPILNRKFSEDEINQIMHDGVICDKNDNCEFKVVHDEIVSFDKEKSSSDREIVIKKVSNGKLYMAILNDSQWAYQDEHNAEQEWYEVKRIKSVSYKYQEI